MGARAGGVLQVGGDQPAGDALRRRKPEGVLEQLVVEQALLLAIEAEQPQGLLLADRDGQLAGEVELLAAVVRQDGRTAASRVERVRRKRGTDGGRVHLADGVHHPHEGDPGHEGTVGLQEQAVEAKVAGAGEGPVGFIRRPAVPLRSAVDGDDVDDAGQRLAVAGGERVGGQRRLGQDVRRNADAERIRRRVELVLHAHAVEDERLLPQAAAPVARADRSRGERHGFVERTDRQVADLLPGDALFGGGRKRVEHGIDLGLDGDGVDVDDGGLERDVQQQRASRPHEQAVPGVWRVPDQDRLELLVAALHLAEAIVAAGVGRGAAAAVLHADEHVRDAEAGLCVPDGAGNGAGRLGGQRRDEREEEHSAQKSPAHGAS